MADLSYLASADAVGRILRERDGAPSPLGPLKNWPQSLHDVLRMCLHSKFPYIVYWGPELVTFWNEAAAFFFDTQHPGDLGKPLHEVQPDAMRTLGPMLRQVMTHGKAVLCADLQLIYRRHGYIEELYETFSYSPLIDEAGRVQGIITPIFDTTAHVIGQRRLSTLRELAAQTADARSLKQFGSALADCVARNRADLPLAALYVADTGDDSHRLQLLTGGPDAAAWPPVLDLHDDDSPLAAALRSGTWESLPASSVFDPVPVSACDRPPDTLLVVPVAMSGASQRSAFLVSGVNPYKQLDVDYRSFFALVAAQMAQGLANAWAFEDASDRARAELAGLMRLTTMGELATSIAHEVNQPLAAIVIDGNACLRWLTADPPNLTEARSAAERIVRSGRHAGEVVARIRRFLHRGPPQRGELSLVQSVWDGLSLIQGEARRKNVVLRAQMEAEVPTVSADKVQMQQVIVNLLINAIEAMPVDGERLISVEVGTSTQPRGVKVAVHDTGIGLQATDRSRLFEAFYTTKPEGLGFGLSISRSIVESHGGLLWAEPRTPSGTTFAFVLPMDPAPAA